MNIFRSFFIVLFFTFSLHAFITSDVDNSFQSDCSGVNLANAKVIDVNSTECYSINGGVDGPANNEDLFIFRATEDMNMSYSIFNHLASDHEITYSINKDSCVDASSNILVGEEVDGNITGVTAGSYVYLTLATSYNQPSTYSLNVAASGVICSGGGSGIPGTFDPSLHKANVDVVDDFSYTAPNYDSYIKTKTSNKNGYAMKVVYLGTGESEPLVPQPYNGGSGGSTASIAILLKLADFSDPTTTCANATPINLFTTVGGSVPVSTYIDDGEIWDTTNQFVMAYAPDEVTPLAKKDIRFMYKSVDFNQLIIDSGIQCAQKSSTGGVVEGIPACLISDSLVSQAVKNYEIIFGTDAVTKCYTQNGQPCYASNGGIGAPPYDHELGCFECSVGSFPYVCSQDNFSIRPDKFEITSTNSNMPDLLRSGSDYNTTIHAYDYGTTNDSEDYNQPKANIIVNESIVLAADGSTTALDGNTNWGSGDFNMTNGISTNGVTNEVAGINFDNVGKVNIIVKDKNWALVDINNPTDPTVEACTADGAWICGDANLTFIPHHFGFSDINITNSDNNGTYSNFTYISNLDNSDPSTFVMSGRIQATIIAQNEVNGTATNFREGSAYYEHPVSATSAITILSHGDANSTIIAPALLGFLNGEKIVTWNENNLSKVLRFNFPREVNVEANPFEVNASDVNLSAVALYTQAPVAGYDSDANISGSESGLGDGKTTFIYGRSHASRQRYSYNETDTAPYQGVANIYYEAYCFNTDSFGITCENSLLPNGLSSKRTDDLRWFVNENHRSGSGSAGTTVEKDGLTRVTGTDTTGNHQDSTTLSYDGTRGFPYKTTMHNNASPWLIYNESDPFATRNEFQVEFDNIGAWTGENETDTTTTTPAGATTNRRIMW